MDNITLDKIYTLIGELYVNSRLKLVDVESSFKNLVEENKKLYEEYNKVNEERNRLLAEIAHVKMASQMSSQTNDKLPK